MWANGGFYGRCGRITRVNAALTATEQEEEEEAPASCFKHDLGTPSWSEEDPIYYRYFGTEEMMKHSIHFKYLASGSQLPKISRVVSRA